jgi:hypothetical protein
MRGQNDRPSLTQEDRARKGRKSQLRPRCPPPRASQHASCPRPAPTHRMSSTHPCSTRSRQLPPPYGTRDAAHRGLEVQPIILTYPLTMAACHKEPLGSWRAGVRVNKGLGPGRRGSRYLHKPYTWEKGACGRMTTGGDCGQLPRECLPPPQAAGTPGREEWEAGDPQTRMVGSLAFRVAKSVERLTAWKKMRVARFCRSSGTIDSWPVGWPSGWSWSSYGAPFVLYGRRACCVPGFGAEVEHSAGATEPGP